MRKTAVPPHAVRIGDRSTCLTRYLTCKFFLPFLPSLRNQSYEAGSKLEHILLQRRGLTWQEVLKTELSGIWVTSVGHLGLSSPQKQDPIHVKGQPAFLD